MDEEKDRRRAKALKEYPQYEQGMYIERKSRPLRQTPFQKYQNELRRRVHPAPNIGKIHEVIYDKEKGTLKIVYEKEKI